MCFQVIVAALVCLTAACLGLIEYKLHQLPFELRALSSDIEAYEEALSWIGKGRGLSLHSYKYNFTVF